MEKAALSLEGFDSLGNGMRHNDLSVDLWAAE
jgi:hypothetical protein